MRWQPSIMARPDRHNEIEVNLLERGSLTYLLGGRKVTVREQSFSAFWAGVPHQIIDFESTGDYFVATLPLAWFLQCQLPESLVQPLMQGHMISDPRREEQQDDARLFASWEQDLQQEPGELRRAVLLELEARLLRLAHSTTPARTGSGQRRRSASSPADLNKVEQMAAFIALNYTRRLPIEAISRHVGLHPNYAMNLFKERIGTTLVDYITQQRISHAQRLLATTDQRVLGIALASGFLSVSRFNEAFRRECGCSPREYRRGFLHRTPSKTS